ncbi:uncharacterized protein LOC102365388 [Latimeria chalumnae]|uniref:uncharacterized protein LOC102365388 n=1 Tax=Latimeria chalumnae TaxID=7897 RepID=UPI00313ACCF9
MDFLYLPDPAENGAAGNLSASQERELPRIPHRGAAREPSENDHTYSELERPFIRTKFKEDRLYESVAIRDGAKAAGLLDTSELWRSKEGGVGADQKLAPPWQGGGTVTDEYASIRKVKRKKEKDRDEASQPESPEAQQEEVCQGASTQHNICRESSSDILDPVYSEPEGRERWNPALRSEVGTAPSDWLRTEEAAYNGAEEGRPDDVVRSRTGDRHDRGAPPLLGSIEICADCW